MKTAPGSMPWEQAARAALENVPFFVRKKVKARIEATALAQGRSCVTLKDVHLARKAFMEGQETMITGFKVENCFASGGCPNRVLETDQKELPARSVGQGDSSRYFWCCLCWLRFY